MAAAPELLDALVQLHAVNVCGVVEPGDFRLVMDAAEAAIRKATGEE